MAIHPTAIIDKSAEIDPTVEVGAYAIIEGDVHIGPQTRIYPHAYISRGTTLGRACQIHPFAIVGHLPQDTKYDDAPTYTNIGNETIIREHASVHRGTAPESTTSVGPRCFIMATAHVGHNCTVGEEVTLVNAVLLAGHVQVGRRAFLSGGVGIHQFVRIGEMAILSGRTPVTRDVPPFMMVVESHVVGLNVVGLRRAGLTNEERHEIRQAHQILYRQDRAFSAAVDQVAEMVQTEPGRRLVEFLRAESKRGYATAADNKDREPDEREDM
ncbi:MAG: acyl-ACP--UDP-N-acetylglucosamine O-acyltransferase [Planctomycetota bacterium]